MAPAGRGINLDEVCRGRSTRVGVCDFRSPSQRSRHRAGRAGRAEQGKRAGSPTRRKRGFESSTVWPTYRVRKYDENRAEKKGRRSVLEQGGRQRFDGKHSRPVKGLLAPVEMIASDMPLARIHVLEAVRESDFRTSSRKLALGRASTCPAGYQTARPEYRRRCRSPGVGVSDCQHRDANGNESNPFFRRCACRK